MGYGLSFWIIWSIKDGIITPIRFYKNETRLCILIHESRHLSCDIYPIHDAAQDVGDHNGSICMDRSTTRWLFYRYCHCTTGMGKNTKALMKLGWIIFPKIYKIVNPLFPWIYLGENILIFIHSRHWDFTCCGNPSSKSQESVYHAVSITLLLMSWQRKEPGHQQWWYWPVSPGIF